MNITLEQLNEIFPYAAKAGRNEKNLKALNDIFDAYEINTVNRIAGFLSQIGKETVEFLYTHELGTVAYLSKYEPGTKIGASLGNTEKGDSVRYKGRGWIMVTGRYNTQKCSDALGVDFISHPEKLEEPEYAAKSAAWYWKEHNINQACDEDDVKKITKLVNGGYNGLEERTQYYIKAKEVLSR